MTMHSWGMPLAEDAWIGLPARGNPRGIKMTKLEEFQYLSDLCLQASLWRVDKDEGRTAIELEVLDRMNKLKDELNGLDADEKGGQKVPTASEKTAKQKWTEDKCRVGNKWFKKSDCIKVPRKDGIGWKWAVKDSVGKFDSDENPDETKSLSY